MKRPVLILLAALAVMATLLIAAPAQAAEVNVPSSLEKKLLAAGYHRATAAELAAAGVPSTVAALGWCQENLVAYHTTPAGNLYQWTVNQCLDTTGGADADWRSYVHNYCKRNGAFWVGCRFAGTHAVQTQIQPGGSWQTQSATSQDYYDTCGSWCDDSVHTGPYWTTNISSIYDGLRSATNWSPSVRFLLADGSNVPKAGDNSNFSQFVNP